MKKTTLIDIAYMITILIVTGITILFGNMIDFIPKFPLQHPALSVAAMIYIVALLLVGFIKTLNKISDVFSKVRMKNL